MKVVVLGAGGQVGRALLAAVPAGAEAAGLTRAACDIADEAAVQAAVAGADVVFNAAAYTDVAQAEAEPERAMLLNAHAPGWIAAACAEAGARLVHLSSDFVFDGRQGVPYRPDAPPHPLGAYGRSKHEGELAVAAALPAALIVRTAWVHAAAGRNFVSTMLRLMAERGRVEVIADQVGTPTWVAGLADALWALTAADATGLHHFTDAGVASWYDFAVAIGEEAVTCGLLAAPPEVVAITTADRPSAAARPPFSVLDKSATWALLGGPAPHWRVNLRRCLAEMAHG